jgi:hypothetical protein
MAFEPVGLPVQVPRGCLWPLILSILGADRPSRYSPGVREQMEVQTKSMSLSCVILSARQDPVSAIIGMRQRLGIRRLDGDQETREADSDRIR